MKEEEEKMKEELTKSQNTWIREILTDHYDDYWTVHLWVKVYVLIYLKTLSSLESNASLGNKESVVYTYVIRDFLSIARLTSKWKKSYPLYLCSLLSIAHQ